MRGLFWQLRWEHEWKVVGDEFLTAESRLITWKDVAKTSGWFAPDGLWNSINRALPLLPSELLAKLCASSGNLRAVCMPENCWRELTQLCCRNSKQSLTFVCPSLKTITFLVIFGIFFHQNLQTKLIILWNLYIERCLKLHYSKQGLLLRSLELANWQFQIKNEHERETNLLCISTRVYDQKQLKEFPVGMRDRYAGFKLVVVLMAIREPLLTRII